MGTVVTGAVVVVIVGLIIRSMVRDKKTENPFSVEAIVGSAEGTVINIGGDHDGRSKQSEKEKS